MDAFAVLMSILLCAIISMYILNYRKKYKRQMDLLHKLPGPPAFPFVGNISNVGIGTESLIPLSQKFQNLYGHIFRIYTVFFAAIVVSKAEYFETILGNSEEITKSINYYFLEPWLGTGLLTSTGSKWHKHRKMFTPTFHFKILESFVHTFNDKSEILVHRLKQIKEGMEFDMFPHITLCTLDIICETAMGINMNVQLDAQQNSRNSEYVSAIYKLSEATLNRMFRPWLYPNWIFFNLSPLGWLSTKCLKILHGYTNKVVAEKSAARKARKSEASDNIASDEDELGLKKKQAFLDLLLEASEGEYPLSQTEIREEVDTFMFEGHDTTTAAISWCLLLLGNHPDVQDKVLEELQGIFQGETRKITMHDLKEMKYLEMVIKEALRLYPSVPFIGRQLKNDLKIGDYLIAGGTEIRIGIYNIHRDPEYFPNPESFNPDNFLPENVKNRHPYAYVPFSAGPRNCIGQKFALAEEKVILTSILLNFRIKSVEKMEDIKPLPELILRPKSGLRVQLYARSS